MSIISTRGYSSGINKGYSSVGYREKVAKLCKYCKKATIVLNYRPNQYGTFTWIADEVHTGKQHFCKERNKGY